MLEEKTKMSQNYNFRSEKAEMASERATEKKDLQSRNSGLEVEVTRLSEEVKVAAQNARASSGQVSEEVVYRAPILVPKSLASKMSLHS